MVDATPGILTTLNTGSVNGGLGERVLIDYIIFNYSIKYYYCNLYNTVINIFSKWSLLLMIENVLSLQIYKIL